MKILVSACLLGENVKYNGGNNYSEELHEYLKGHEVFSVCPEVLGGLPVPRIPCEIVNGVVFNKAGENKDKEFHDGAEQGLKMVEEFDIDLVILQPRSPSCGTKIIYDGTFSGNKISGNGVFSKLLQANGFKPLESHRDFEVLKRQK